MKKAKPMGKYYNVITYIQPESDSKTQKPVKQYS